MNTIIIGNGPSVLAHKNGKQIDTFDCVVRLNDFVITGFEDYIGTKTSYWIVNEHFIRANKLIAIQAIGAIPKTCCLFPYDGFSNYDHLLKDLPLTKDIIIFEKQMAYDLSQKYDPTYTVWPSTGICAMWYFKPCSIVGFDCFFNGLEHYYETKRESRFNGHSFVRELSFLEELKASKSVTLL